MDMSVLSLHLRRRVPVILQAESAECGLACLAMVASFHGLDSDLVSLRAQFPISLRGITLARLMQLASELRLSPRAVRLEPAALAKLPTPCVLHWNLDHFVVLEKVSGQTLYIIDPAVGRRHVTAAEASNQFTGVALELTPTAAFRKEQLRSPLRLSNLVDGVQGLRSALVKLLSLSLSLQTVALIMPLFTQVIVDEVVPAADTSLLTVLVVAFSAITLLHFAISAIRTALVLNFGARLQFGWGIKLFSKLIRLPLSYFERRSVGDIQSRFRSIGSIQSLASTTMVEAVVDGVMTTTSLVVMVIYAPALTLIPIATLLIYLSLRLLSYRPQRETTQEGLVEAARESSHFLESLRGILAIKTFAKEQVRESAWQNRSADAIRAGFKVALLSSTQHLVNQALFALENLLVVGLAAKAVIDGGFSVGMLIAYLSYKSQFTSRAASLIDKAMEFRLVSVHLDRLADIALEEEEITPGEPSSVGSAIVEGRLEVKDVYFRYSATDPYILSGVNLAVVPGQCVAIAGPSGCGKTTLMKAMLSVLRPESGQILVDGRDILRGSPYGYRRRVAAVMQEDCLLSGTLADNIAFFAPNPDRERVEACAKIAEIHDDIARMPMGYFTQVGDMGASLSGGQKQRVLLARALYSEPRILFLDEATSHLDPRTEERIHAFLAGLKITRVMIAHRRETLAIADTVVQFPDLQAAGRDRTRDLAYCGGS